jgi:hypothetical protein
VFGVEPVAADSWLDAADGSPIQALFVDNDGKVGIGTTSPQQSLSVIGALNVDQANGNPGALQPGISFGSDSGEGIASNRIQGKENYGGLDFYTRLSKRMSITWGGDVGIGTTSPDAKLTLQGVGTYDCLLNVGGSGNGRLKVRHIEGKNDQNAETGGLYLQYQVNQPTVMNAGGSTGNVGIGMLNPQAKLDVLERIRISDSAGNAVLELGKGLDYAEGFDVSGKGETSPGSVLVIDPVHPGKLKLSDCAYDKKVAGIVAGAKGLGSAVRLGVGQFDCDVALAGRVYCNVEASAEAVEAGDLLTTSSLAGYAMKAADHARATGAILGKAMQPLAKGQKGQILVLVTLQ